MNENVSKTLGAHAYDRVLEMILDGTLAPGTLLQEQSLANDLGISRTPVRQALAKLELEGLVTRHGGRLLIVREMPVKEFMEILRVRQMLEGEAIGLACLRLDKDDIAKFRKSFESLMTDPGSGADSQARADDELHGAIADASGNAVLAEIVRTLRRRTQIFNLKNLPDRFLPGCQEHLAIVEALDQRNPALARQRLVDHLENVGESILRKLGGTAGRSR